MRTIEGKLPIKCTNCRRANVFNKDRCPILTAEKDVVAKSLGFENTEDIYQQTRGSFTHPSYRKFMTAEHKIQDKVREEGSCEFDSQYIETPLSILNGIQIEDLKYDYGRKDQTGRFVKIRLASETDKKTYLGIYLGDFPRAIGLSYDREQQTMKVSGSFHNPAIWVFDLKRIVWGSESWWGVIETEDQLKEITDLDIENVWYVKALKSLHEES